MRRLIVYVVLAAAACAPTVVARQSLPPAPSPTAFDLSADLYLESVANPLRSPIVANGDETLAFRLEFHAQMDVASVVAAVKARLPEATAFRSLNDDTAVAFEVPRGSTPFSIDPRGAQTLAKPNIGTVAGISWDISRPGTTLSLYRPVDIVAGSTRAAETYRFAFAADPGLIRLDPDRRVALVSVAAPPHLSFVELATGKRTALPADLNKIGVNGAYMHWLADGRFLTLGTHETVVAGPLGDDGRRLPTLTPGQSGSVAPNERSIALESYSTDDAAIQDLETGDLRSLGGGYTRCSAYSSAAMSWSPDSRTVAIGYCAQDMAGPGRTVFIDAGNARRVRTLEGWSVVAWLPNGTMLARSWSDLSENYARVPDSNLALLDPEGRLVRRIESPMPFGLSPDGRWLLDSGLDAQNPTIRLVEIATGRNFPLGIAGAFPSWTADGLIAVIAKA